MKIARLTFLLLLAAILIACGSSGTTKTINGTWQANLVSPSGSAAYLFLSGLSQGTGSTVTVSNFDFNSPAPCFSMPLGQSATFSVSGASNGYETGPFQMTINTLFPQQVNNVLQLNGTRNSNGSISGSWTVTGLTGCPASGTFTMNLRIPVDQPVP